MQATWNPEEPDALAGMVLWPGLERWAGGRPAGERGVFVLVDIDRFILFNDVNGHRVGDSLLRDLDIVLAAADELHGVDSENVICARLHGKLAVMAAGVDLAAGTRLAKRIEAQVDRASSAWPKTSGNRPVTVKLAVMSWSAPIDMGKVFERANELLYANESPYVADRSRTATEPGSAE